MLSDLPVRICCGLCGVCWPRIRVLLAEFLLLFQMEERHLEFSLSLSGHMFATSVAFRGDWASSLLDSACWFLPLAQPHWPVGMWLPPAVESSQSPSWRQSHTPPCLATVVFALLWSQRKGRCEQAFPRWCGWPDSSPFPRIRS